MASQFWHVWPADGPRFDPLWLPLFGLSHGRFVASALCPLHC